MWKSRERLPTWTRLAVYTLFAWICMSVITLTRYSSFLCAVAIFGLVVFLDLNKRLASSLINTWRAHNSSTNQQNWKTFLLPAVKIENRNRTAISSHPCKIWIFETDYMEKDQSMHLAAEWSGWRSRFT